jgi:hypothetical protein
MAGHSWEDCPDEIRGVVEGLVDTLRELLRAGLSTGC